MEWTKDTANTAYDTTKDTANTAYDSAANPGETASTAYNTTAKYTPVSTEDDDPEKNASSTFTGSSILNTPPFNSFKPDPSTVWKAYVIYVTLTIGCTLPWWAFVTAADYFQQLYPGNHIIRCITLAYFVPWVIGYSLFIWVGRGGNSWVKITVGLAIETVALALIAVLAFITGDHGTTVTFWVTLLIVVIAGAADALGQGSLLRIYAELPESYTEAYAIGAVSSGVLVFIVRVITKASLSSSSSGLRIGAIIYFSVAALVPVLAIALFAYVHNMPEMGYYNSLNLGSFDTVRLLLQDEASVSKEVAAGAAIASVAAGRSTPAEPFTWKPVLNRIKLLFVAVIVTSIVSLSIFPGHLAEDIRSSYFGSWSPVLLVGTYAIFDLLGRICIGYFSPQRGHPLIFGLSWSRALLIVFFVLVLLGPSILTIEILFFLTALLGFSNGYLTVSLIVVIPKSNPANDAATAGIIQALLTNVGVLVGAGLSWLWLLTFTGSK